MLDARGCNAFNVPRWQASREQALALAREGLQQRRLPTGRALAQRTGLTLAEAGQVIALVLGVGRG